MKKNPLKNLLKTAFLLVAVLLSFVGFGKNLINQPSYASSLASVSKAPAYKWKGNPVLEEDNSNEAVSVSSPTACMTLSVSTTDATCSGTSTGSLSLTVTGGVAPYYYELTDGMGRIRNATSSSNAYLYSASIEDGSYNFTVVSADGCSASISATVNYVYATPVITILEGEGVETFCTAGQTTTLTASGASTYTWSTGATTTAITATAPSVPLTYNFYSVTGTSSDGCISNTVFADLQLHSGISLFLENSTPTICGGQTTTLSAFGATSYTWNPGGATTFSIVVSPSVTTVYTVTGADACATAVANVTVTVSSGQPTISVSGASSICDGGSATYTASGTANSYDWSIGNSFLESTTSNTITIDGDDMPDSESSTLLVIGTNTTTGCTNSATLTITNPTPTFTLTNQIRQVNAICPGDSYTINASIYPTSSSYNWTPSLTGLNPVASPSVTTDYTLTVTSGSCTTQGVFTLFVASTPTISLTSPVNVCSGSNYTITPTVDVGSNTNTIYNWSPSTNLSSTSTATTVASGITSNASYTLTVSNLINNVATLDLKTSLVCQESVSIDLNVVPNPTLSISGNTFACPNYQDTLTASGATSYTWSSAGATLTTNPVIIGVGSQLAGFVGFEMFYDSTQVFTVVGSGSNGCTSTATYTVVSPVPTFTYNLNTLDAHYDIPLAICSGTSYTLHAQIESGNTYTWTPALDGTLNPVISPTVSTGYTLTVSNGTCTASGSAHLGVLATPTVTLVTENICVGTSYTINPTLAGVNGGTIYNWSPPTDLSSTNTATTVATPSTSTSYSLIAENHLFDAVYLVDDTVADVGAISCRDTASININILPSPTVSISGNPTICSYDFDELTVSGASTYTWSDGTNLSYLVTGGVNSGGTVPMSGSQTFSVTGTDVNGCTATAFYTVTDLSPTFTLNPSNTSPPFICSGSSYTLNAQLGAGVTSYTWTNDDSTLSGLNPVVTPTITSRYQLSVSNGTCTADGSINIFIVPTPTVNVSPSSPTVCQGGSDTIFATIVELPITKGREFYFTDTTYYSWIPTDGLSSTNTPTTVATPGSNTSYSLVSTNYYYPANIYTNDTTFTTDTLFCRDTARVTINITSPPPVPTINYSSVCDSNYTTLNIPGPNGTYTYTWQGPCYDATGSSVNVNTVGVYTVSVTNSCRVVTTNTISVLLIGNIVAGFQTHLIHAFIEEGGFGTPIANDIHFENLSLGNNLIYDWTFGNGDTSSVTNPTELFDSVGVFTVHLYDTDSMNCRDTASATVVLSGNNTVLIIPNRFTPNNDNVDDVFEINGTGVTNFKCQISDKWGNLLYQWNNLNGSWNGIASNGHVFPNGNYFYLLSYTDYYGINQSRSGIVNLKN